ncbi:DUF1700 domain-containing protein [Liquorilactobacillus satsumensis]|uniref:DUF1700 domain-containing protein n=1 Tax=Liquorilactobacillus satsumensis TaxID=259059 RepID=UPI001E2EA16A|nr:DUF1700 domain-containing protein [Liquorilactobacillus satsumensis]MCC7666744.1 hypothetical protein [Liquorilactobacillus satsumensis]MCP9357620.1 DUF1700 domain-containing protein [Liquorilactobacillus satsumensis]MCP9371914.1 DUF1700 domain-containing protein [Liquorilactobacillus satsumensis]
MDRDRYLDELKACLQGLTVAEVKDAVAFYAEYLSDAQLEQRAAIEEKLGTPRQLARKIMADYSIRDDEHTTGSKVKSAHANSRMIWLIILALLSAPFALGAVGVGGGVLIAVIFLILAFFMVGAGLLLAILLLTAFFLYSGVVLLFQEFNVGIFYLGCGMACLGLLLLIVPCLFWFGRVLIQAVANFARYLYRKFNERRRAN